MKKYFYFPLLLLFCYFTITSQVIETIRIPPHGRSERFLNTNKKETLNTLPRVLLNPQLIRQQKKWNVTLEQHGVNHGNNIPENRVDSIKHEGLLLKRERELQWRNDPQVDDNMQGNLSLSPNINLSFKGNAYNNWAPCDNSIAVSDDGFVVSVINTSILFADEYGHVMKDENLDDFLSALNLNGGYFDPRVIYDPMEDKFILVVLNGNTPTTSTIAIGFSTTSNPNDDWWFYAFSGDPTGSNVWFDYPSIGISTDDIYISGNQYTTERVFQQALIYQLAKGPGYRGEVVNGLHWYDIRDAHGNPDFTVTPISYGFDGTLGPGIYFISTDAGGGTEATLYYTDNSSENNPNLYAYNTTIPNYYMPYNGFMLGSEDQLKTNDCRTQSGFYAEGTIHFVFNSRGDDLHTKVNYCRLFPEDLTQNTLSFGLQPYEYAFPCVAPFGNETTDKSVLIGFLRTSSTIYPEFRMAMVDDEMNYLGSSLVKEGEAFIDFSAETAERWGDYCGISKRHSENGTEVWISGSYGESNDNGVGRVLCTWIAQIKDTETATTRDAQPNNLILYPNPVSSERVNVDFEIDVSTECNFLVVDEQGRAIKNLLYRAVKEGLNHFSFSTDPLMPGTYYLVIQNKYNRLLKSVPFIVM